MIDEILKRKFKLAVQQVYPIVEEKTSNFSCFTYIRQVLNEDHSLSNLKQNTFNNNSSKHIKNNKLNYGSCDKFLIDIHTDFTIVLHSSPGMDFNWCKQPEIGLPKPDCVFLFSLSSEKLAQRPGFGGERYEDQQMQEKVSDVFLKLSKQDDNWDIIDADGTIEEVSNKVLFKALKVVENAATTPLKRLKFDKKFQNGC